MAITCISKYCGMEGVSSVIRRVKKILTPKRGPEYNRTKAGVGGHTEITDAVIFVSQFSSSDVDSFHQYLVDRWERLWEHEKVTFLTGNFTHLRLEF